MSGKVILNEKNSITEKIIHLVITPLCGKDCKYCCNKQYDWSDIPVVTDEELKRCKMLCLTGGEPFKFSNPSNVAAYYKIHYPNIEKVIVYSSASDAYFYSHDNYEAIDGLTLSIKDPSDLKAFNDLREYDSIHKLNYNRVYCFPYGQYGSDIVKFVKGLPSNFDFYEREWQEVFTPAPDSIFRKIF